jgi:hypothetical protein
MSTARTVLAGLVLLLGLAPARGQVPLPDLEPDRENLQRNLSVDLLAFAPDHCVLQPEDLCVGGPGARKLLRFSVLAVNHGPGEVRLGTPAEHPELFERSPCHGHFHFATFARYELRTPGGDVAATGHKQSFCVEDTQRVAADAAQTPKYRCEVVDENGQLVPAPQGVQVGWGDLYPSSLDCQWIDITDVPPGTYELRVLLNTAGIIPEVTLANNMAAVPVTIEGPTAEHPAPRVKVRSPTRRTRGRAGRRLAIRWKRRVPHGGRVRLQDVWFSRDDGATWEIVATGLGPAARALRWTVPADAATDTARVRVVVWSQDMQRGDAVSRAFRVRP